MSAKFPTPKGWRLLRPRTTIRKGDKFTYAKKPKRDDWYPTGRAGDGVPPRDLYHYIRRAR